MVKGEEGYNLDAPLKPSPHLRLSQDTTPSTHALMQAVHTDGPRNKFRLGSNMIRLILYGRERQARYYEMHVLSADRTQGLILR